MDNKKHVLIIGGGLSGLLNACILLKNGFKVSLLEKHFQIGGCLQTFTRKGKRFDTGMHYFGSINKGEVLYKIFKYVDIIDKINLFKIDYDIINYKNRSYKLMCDKDAFINKLAKDFPNEIDSINKYVDKIYEVSSSSSMFNLTIPKEDSYLKEEFIETSVYNYLSTFVKNNDLKNVLCGLLPLYAGEKEITPFYLNAYLHRSYLDGSYRIIGGSATLANALVNEIKSMGGQVILNANVNHIHIKDKLAIGVDYNSNQYLPADYIISTIHPKRLFEITDSSAFRKIYKTRLKNIPDTISSFTIYLSFKSNRVDYMPYNYYHYYGDEIWGGENYTKENWPRNFLYMHMSDYKEQRYANSGVVICYMNFEDVKEWSGTSIGRRGKSYEEYKKEKAEKVINLIDKEFAGFKDSIEDYYTSSPLTYRDYTGSENGSLYGMHRDCRRNLETTITPQTKIKNLYLSGQNISMHGMLGVSIGALITCSNLVEIDDVLDQINKE